MTVNDVIYERMTNSICIISSNMSLFIYKNAFYESFRNSLFLFIFIFTKTFSQNVMQHLTFFIFEEIFITNYKLLSVIHIILTFFKLF